MCPEIQPLFHDLRDGSRIEGVCLCLSRTLARGRGERPYLVATLSDSRRIVDARLWEKAEEAIAKFENGDLVKVQGVVVAYQGRLQLHLGRIERASDPALAPRDFLPRGPCDPEALWQQLRELVQSVTQPSLYALLKAMLDDPDIAEAFRRCPGGKSIHHAYVGGLLEHTLSVARLVDHACAHYTKLFPGFLDRDLALAAALLHDIGKTRELAYESSFEYTDSGRLLGHIVLGISMVEEKMRNIPGFPETLGLRLRHALLAHHGTLEHGSPKVPMTAEAFLVHHADALDCELGFLAGVFEREGTTRWTTTQTPYGRCFFRGLTSDEEGPAAS